DLADEAGADAKLVRERLRLGGRLALGGQEVAVQTRHARRRLVRLQRVPRAANANVHRVPRGGVRRGRSLPARDLLAPAQAVAAVGDDPIGARRALDHVARAVAGVDDVVAGSGAHEIHAGAGEELVVAHAADDHVALETAVEQVVAGAADEAVAAVAAPEAVIAAVAVEDVVALAAP